VHVRTDRAPKRWLARRLTVLAGIGVVTVTSMLLAGCGGGGGTGTSNQSIDEQIGLDTDVLAQRQTVVENVIRNCMKAQGFDYVPVDPVSQQAALTGVRGMSKDDFEKQFGYGITTLYEQRLQQAATGPNQRIRDALAPTDRRAYDRTLYGTDTTATFAQALDSGDFSVLGGCVRKGAEKVFGGAAVLDALTGKLNALDERIKQDARMVDAIDGWSRCMRNAGYDLQDPDQLDVSLTQQLDDIVGPPEARDPDYDRAALNALGREEVAIVESDKRCEERHIAAVEEKVRVEYEREFRSGNQGLLSKVPKP
jgi:hypothetical protein